MRVFPVDPWGGQGPWEGRGWPFPATRFILRKPSSWFGSWCGLKFNPAGKRPQNNLRRKRWICRPSKTMLSTTSLSTTSLPTPVHPIGAASSAGPPAFPDEPMSVAKAYIAAVHSVLTGQSGAPEAAAELERQLIKITGFGTGPPKTLD